jgi:hypothetical protein
LGAADPQGSWSNSVGVSSPWSPAMLGDHLPVSSSNLVTPPLSGDVPAPKTPSTLWHGGWSSKPSDLKPAEETRAAIRAIYALHRPSARALLLQVQKCNGVVGYCYHPRRLPFSCKPFSLSFS